MEILKGLYALLKIMLFSSQTVINTTPITVTDEVTRLKFPEPVTALNYGASIEIDVTHIFGPYENINEGFDRISAKYPKGCLKARLIAVDGSEFVLDETGSAIGENSYVVFHSFKAIPLNIEFEFVEVTSCSPIKDATLVWRNSGM